MKCEKMAECKERVSEGYFKRVCMKNPVECPKNYKVPKEWQREK